MNDEFKNELLITLKNGLKRSDEVFERSTGKRGSTNNSQCNFYLGVKSVMRDMIEAIEKGNVKPLKRWEK